MIIVLSFLISIKCRPQNNASDELFQQCDDSEGCHPTGMQYKKIKISSQKLHIVEQFKFKYIL